MTCPDCKGKGEWSHFMGIDDCFTCNGKGQLTEKEHAELLEERKPMTEPHTPEEWAKWAQENGMGWIGKDVLINYARRIQEEMKSRTNLQSVARDFVDSL